MCHGEFLYLVFEGKGPVSPSWQKAVLHPELAEVGHDDPWRARALRNDNNWGAGLNIQQNPGSPLRMIPYLQGETEKRRRRTGFGGREDKRRKIE